MNLTIEGCRGRGPQGRPGSTVYDTMSIIRHGKRLAYKKVSDERPVRGTRSTAKLLKGF